MGGHFFGLCNRKGFDERPQNAAVWRFAARGFAGRMVRAGSVRSSSVTKWRDAQRGAQAGDIDGCPQRNPANRTTSSRASLSSRRFLYLINKSSHRLVSPLLFSANDLACFSCSLVNALATFPQRYQSFAGMARLMTCLFRSASGRHRWAPAKESRQSHHNRNHPLRVVISLMRKSTGRRYKCTLLHCVDEPFSADLYHGERFAVGDPLGRGNEAQNECGPGAVAVVFQV